MDIFPDLLKKGQVGEKLRTLQTKTNPRSPGYFWAGDSLNFEEACKHFVAVGATGSGKSITLNLLMQSVFSKMGSKDGIKRRALVYDSKADLVSFLAGLLPMERIKILNPLDRRFSPWDIAADITTETDAYEFASILIPRNERESSPYFSDTARSLIAGVIKRFNASAPRRWTFRDLILAFETSDQLRDVLDHPETRYLLEHFHEDNRKNFGGVKSTVDNTIALYRPIAALFESASQPPISLKSWLHGEDSILVLGNYESAREATDTLNKLMFRQLSKFIIGREGRIQKDETWVFLDELREAGALSGLRQLLLRGRSKGVAVAIGFQDLEGIYAAYGEHEGAEIVGAAQNTVLLHLNATATKTTEWASKVCGSPRDVAASTSETTSSGSPSSTGEGKHLELIPNVLPMQFTELPMPSPKAGLHYYAFTEANRYGRGQYAWEFLEKDGPLDIRSESEEAADFLAHKDVKKLIGWTVDDRRRLNPEDTQPVNPTIPDQEDPLKTIGRGTDKSGFV